MQRDTRKLNGLIREVNTFYKQALRDGRLDNRETLHLMKLFQSALSLMKQGLTHVNPEKCYMAYATGLSLRKKKLTDKEVIAQAKKDGYEDPNFVLWLFHEAYIDTKENPRGGRMQGRNLGYGTTNGGMAKNQLRTIKRRAVELHDAIRDADELPDWVLSKITVAQDRLVVATDYILSKLREMELIKQGYKMNPFSEPYDPMYVQDELNFAEEAQYDYGIARMKKSIKKLTHLLSFYSTAINRADQRRIERLIQRMKRCLSRGNVNHRLLKEADRFTSQFRLQDEEFSSEDSWEEEVSSEDWDM